MNKRILISLSVIGLVAAIAIGGTIAYFSDTETSTGNTFSAGSIDLTIDNHCYYNGDECVYLDECEIAGYYWNGVCAPGNECYCSWDLTNLTDELFFNFSDLKPGDWGEDTVSIHVDNNDAWACVAFTNLVSADNTCTEPESADDPDGATCEPNGELDDELEFFFWADICTPQLNPSWEFAVPGDNIFQPECDIELMYGPASGIVPDGEVYTLADADENNVGGSPSDPLTGEEDYYIGKVWCFGELYPEDVTPGGFIWYCDGSEVENASQSDSLMGDITFYAVQSRNNANFQCGVDWPEGK